MATNISEYRIIRNQITGMCQCSSQDLQRLKDAFADKVKSRRRLDNVTNVEDLVRVLEKRNFLNKDDLRCLNDIARLLGRNDVLRLINLHNNLMQPAVPIPTQAPTKTSVLNCDSASVRERIHELISDEIGAKWKDLARAMKISEGKIDELEERHRYISERVREILLHYERNGPFSWLPLLDALSASRRNDLRGEVQNILNESLQRNNWRHN